MTSHETETLVSGSIAPFKYQAPDVETVISLSDINQETLYAGSVVGSGAPAPPIDG